MNSITQENKKLEDGLNILLNSFELQYGLVTRNDTIRVSITTLPEEHKQHFEISASKICNCNHLFTVNITNETKKIIFVFRRKDSQLKNPIIASTIINSKHFPKMAQNIYQNFSGTKSNEIHKFKIFEPIQKNQAEKVQKVSNRRMLGEMKVELSLTSPYPTVIQSKENNNQSKNLKQVKKLNKKPFDVKVKYQKLKDDENVPILESHI